ncbi:MAG: tRNA (adenosine(37)-N6)-threonylcarbamoyltransferase complex transferase subunit TsaD [Deltaproteobacteria bacterium]|nr:tRNA (adenosine(37)-N6)-threonylcarbamoyltransferase complex transferase subunit TsaD [Deltaproteobacteria bacterium]
MLVLGLESSCDETAVAVTEGGRVLAETVRSQIDLHQKYGGVVPEIASRAHLEAVESLTEETLKQAGLTLGQIEGLAVTQGPGLVGALLVAVNFAKGLALALNLPIAGVNHVRAHALAPFLSLDSLSQDSLPAPQFPYVALVASGGHTSLFLVEDFLRFELLGQTLDDAAGEAFDKFAKLLGLGYPGGGVVERLARQGRSDAFKITRPLLREGLNFSFSGLKTQVMGLYNDNQLDQAPLDDQRLADLAASFQAAVVEVLVTKLTVATKRTGARGAALTGGVACNGPLRQAAAQALGQANLPLWAPPPAWCADNGAMIAFLGGLQLAQGHNLLDLAAEALPRWPGQ